MNRFRQQVPPCFIKDFVYLKLFYKTVSIAVFSLFLFFSQSLAQAPAAAEEDSLQIVYLANASGVFENCRCGSNPLGGLDHIAFLLKELRKKNPRLLFIDGGDFTNTYPYNALNKLIVDIYKALRPDYLMLADQEMQQENEYTLTLLRQSSFRFLATNYDMSGFNLDSSVKISAGKKKIVLLSYLDKSSFWYSKPVKGLYFNEEKFARVYRQAVQTSDFRMVLFHGEDAGLAEFTKKFPEIDLIFLGHSQSARDALDGKPVIIAPGSDTEFLTLLSLRFQNNGSPLIKTRKIPISLQIPTEPAVEKLILHFKKTREQK
ncbi:hypothetical protein [Caldithrix abyssi]